MSQDLEFVYTDRESVGIFHGMTYFRDLPDNWRIMDHGRSGLTSTYALVDRDRDRITVDMTIDIYLGDETAYLVFSTDDDRVDHTIRVRPSGDPLDDSRWTAEIRNKVLRSIERGDDLPHGDRDNPIVFVQGT